MLRKTITNFTSDVLTSRPVSAVMQPLRSQCIPVFMLHRMEDAKRGVNGHSALLLESALQFIKDNDYTPISINSLVDALLTGASLPKRAVAFTLDDGFYDQAEYAFPLFERFQVPATIFMVTNMMDFGAWSWDFRLDYIITQTNMQSVSIILDDTPFSAELKTPKMKRMFIRKVRYYLKAKPESIAYQAVNHLADQLRIVINEKAPETYQAIQWSQARALESEYIQFGPHTCSHPILTRLSGEDSRHEIEFSWQRIKTELSNPCPVFCYPTGRPKLDFGEREKKIVSNLGLKAALSTESGYVENTLNKNDLFSLKRFSFPDNLAHFKQYCSWIERAKDKLLYR
jgi:peptidoglycan/xylan/chitin deacetylase (PgdA/CDA1 family)